MSRTVDNLIEKFDTHEFEIVVDPDKHNKGDGTTSSAVNFSILNPDNEKYIVVSAVDNWRCHFMPHLGWQPEKMVKMFYSGGFSFLEYFSLPAKWHKVEDIRDVYRSFYYGPYDHRHQEFIRELYEKRKPENDALIFRGLMFEFRQKIMQEFPSVDDIKIIDKRAGGTQLSYLDYLKEISNYKAALSLPGMTEICNRDIECFAVGTPVLRPLLHTNYPDPLIPDYHYINCFVDCQYNENGYPGYTSNSDFQKYLINKWNQIKKKKEFLAFVSENARNWYLKNCTIENNMNYLLSQIRLEDLNG